MRKVGDIVVLASRRKFMNPLSKEEFAELKNQVNNEGGIVTPLDIDQDNKLLDGHNRLKICKEMGLDLVPVTVHNIADERQAEMFMLERSIGRRNLTKPELEKCIRLLYEQYKGKKGAPKGNKNQKGVKTGPQGAKEKVAKKLNITPAQVKTALNKTKTDGTPKEKKRSTGLEEAYRETARAITVLRMRWDTTEDEEYREWVDNKLAQLRQEIFEGKVRQLAPSEIQNEP